jgi:hypothetical protein
MVYVKSFLTGVASLALAVLIVLALAFVAVQMMEWRSPDGGIFAIGVTNFRPWRIAAIALSIFGAGFYWSFRRSRRHR